MPESNNIEDNAFFKMIKDELENDPEMAQAIFNEKNVNVLTYKIDFKKVTSFEELLKILNHLQFVITGPQEYFDTCCSEIKDYLVQVEEVEQEGS